MEDIKINITNGNWTDAVRLIKNSNLSLGQVIQSLIDDDIYISDVVPLLDTMESVGYIIIDKHFETK